MLNLFLLTAPFLAQSYMPNMAPSSYQPKETVERQEKLPNYYDPNREKLPYYNQNNPNPAVQQSDGQQISILMQNFLRSVQKDDLNDPYTWLTSPFFRNATSFEQFKYFINTHPALTKNKAIYVGNSEVQYETAIVTLDITNLEGQSEKFDFYLMRDNGEWKILGILTEETPPPAAPMKK